jgi:hypothetical protein
VTILAPCGGTGQICVAVRAGDADHLSDDDCTLATVCSDLTYDTPGKTSDATGLPGWTASSAACAERKETLGAYLEFTLHSATLGCGMGADQTTRIPVCPARCATEQPDAGDVECPSKCYGASILAQF